MRFPYKELPVTFARSSRRKRVVFRPIIPVIFLHNKRIASCEALIDSGADFKIIDREVYKITKEYKPDFVGITCVSQNFNIAKIYAKYFHKKNI